MTTEKQTPRDILRELFDIDTEHIRKKLRKVVESNSDKLHTGDLKILRNVLSFKDDKNIRQFVRTYVKFDRETLRSVIDKFVGIEAVEINMDESLVTSMANLIGFEQPLSGRVKYIAAEALSAALSDVAPHVSDYAQPKTAFIHKAVQSFADDSTTNGEFLTKVSLVISTMYPMCDFPSTTFAKRLGLMFYLPEMLRNVSHKEAIPEIFLDPSIPEAHIPLFEEAYVLRAEKIALILLNRANNAKTPLNLRVDPKMISEKICTSLDKTVRENLDDDVMFFEDIFGQVVVFSVSELRRQFMLGNFQNPYTREDFDKDFIQSFSKAYRIPLKIDMASLVRNFMDVIRDDIEKRIECSGEDDPHKRKICVDNVEEGHERRKLSKYAVTKFSTSHKLMSDVEGDEDGKEEGEGSEESGESEESEGSEEGEEGDDGEEKDGSPSSYKTAKEGSPSSYKSAKDGSPSSYKTAKEESPSSYKTAEGENEPAIDTCYLCGDPLTFDVKLRTVVLDKDGTWKEIAFCSYACMNREKKAFE